MGQPWRFGSSLTGRLCWGLVLLLLVGQPLEAKMTDIVQNRLATAASPYLRQHADNPVDWYPWGEEAFSRAQREGKLIFLSIGYSTCHWCHVMAHESFEDAEVAALLNQDFIAIKVDREERPDIDQVFMEACVRLTGQGGWPLTVILTPDRVPFFAGTYFPKQGRYGRPGLTELLPQLARGWRDDPEKLTVYGQQLVNQLKTGSGPGSSRDLPEGLADQAAAALANSYDVKHGGFGPAPKFPRPHDLTYLLRRWRRSGEAAYLQAAEGTLQALRAGGIYDQVGFGFHRYSTDVQWLLPHFEKMLYDQAGLIIAYLEAYQATGKAEYATTVREVIAYVERDLKAPGGGFYSAEDADSEGVEGKFYLWNTVELRTLLGKEDAALVERFYAATEEGNFTPEADAVAPGSNILHRPESLDQVAADLKLEPADLRKRLELARQRLLRVRSERVRPHRDEKIVTAWNGMMITALARAAVVLDEPEYGRRAEAAATFVWERLRDRQGRLLRRYSFGEAGIGGFAEDYACYARGLLDLYAVDFDPRWLRRAMELSETLATRFVGEDGALFDTADDAEALLLRPRSTYDGAYPAANSFAQELFARLYLLTGERRWEERGRRQLASLSGLVVRHPQGYTGLLQGALLFLEPTRELVVAGSAASPATRALLAAVRGSYLPEGVLLLADPAELASLTPLVPFVAGMRPLKGEPAAYLCQNHSCQKPLTDAADLARQLSRSP